MSQLCIRPRFLAIFRISSQHPLRLLLWGVLFFLLLPCNASAEVNGLINVHREFRTFRRYFKSNPTLLKLALESYNCGIAEEDANKPGILTIVDYQRPSYFKRLWVLNLFTHKMLYHTYVAHGVGSGKIDAIRFSNTPDSYKTSLGLYKTGESYFGEWGYAMRLNGLERGFNSNAFRRHIVFHGGTYVSRRSIRNRGMIGMSHGCIVVPVTQEHEIIDTLQGGTLIFVYYPRHRWLADSHFLHCPILLKRIEGRA